MAHIKSRKHPAARSVAPGAKAATVLTGLVALSLPLHAQTAPTLPQVTVKGESAADYKSEQLASPKFTQPLVDTTQTVTVIKDTVLKEQTASTLTEALRNVPGVGTFNIGENGRMNTGDAISMRGFDSSNSIFVDGIRDLGNVTRDVFNIDQIEVIKGPSGTDYGRTAASGSINLVTKQPKLEDSFDASLGVGTGSYKRSTVDWNKSLTGLPGAALRLNVVGEDSGVAGRDTVKNKKWGVAPSLALGLGTDSRIYIDLLHVKQNNIPDGGVSTVGLKGYNSSITNAAVRDYLNSHAVNPSNYYGTNGDFDHSTADMATLRVEHDFSGDTKLRNTLRWGRLSHDYQATAVMAPTAVGSDPLATTVARSGNNGDSINKILTNQTNLTTKLWTGAFEHDISTGLELTRETMDTTGWSSTVPATNLYAPDSSLAYTRTLNPFGDTTGKMDTYAVYAFDTLKLNKQWQLNGGVRLEHYKLKASYWNNVGTRTSPVYEAVSQQDSGNLFNWKVGALFKPADNGSIYLNYAIQLQPPGTVSGGDGITNANFIAPSVAGSSANDLNYDPQRTRTVELGTKWDLLGKKLLLTAALFRTELSNEIQADPVLSNVYYQDGKKTVQGLELGAVGQITPLWSVSSGFTIQHTKTNAATQTQTGTVSADGSNTLPFTPKTAFTLWSTYQVAPQFSIGGGARYMGSMKKARDGATVGPSSIPAYWVADAMVGYRVTRNLSLQFNVTNLFDKDYVASINRGGHRYYPGAERAYRLTANLDF